MIVVVLRSLRFSDLSSGTDRIATEPSVGLELRRRSLGGPPRTFKAGRHDGGACSTVSHPRRARPPVRHGRADESHCVVTVLRQLLGDSVWARPPPSLPRGGRFVARPSYLTGDVALDVAEADPPPFEADTRARRRSRLSAEVATYELAVAPPMVTQDPIAVDVQRSHS